MLSLGIKSRYRELLKHHHPDAGNTDGMEAILQINSSSRNVLDFVGEYRFFLPRRSLPNRILASASDNSSWLVPCG